MHVARFGNRVQLRIARGWPIAASLIDWLRSERIGYAALSGLGAVSSATVSYWNAETRQYEPHELNEQMEVVSLVGNAALRDGEPFLHIHVTLGRRDLSVVGGHFNEGTVHPNLEIWLHPEQHGVDRIVDEECGLYLLDLPDRG